MMFKKESVLKKIIEFLLKYKFTIFCLVYFVAISYVLVGYYNNYYLVSALSFFFLIHLLSRSRYLLVVTILFSILITIDAYFAFVFGSQMSTALMSSILETTSSEVRSMMKELLLKGVLIFAFTLFIIIKSQKELEDIRIPRIVSFLIFFGYWFALVPFYIQHKVAAFVVYTSDFKESPGPVISSISEKRFPLVFYDFISLYTSYKEGRRFPDYIEAERKLPKGIIKDEMIDSPSKIFLIIGESSNRDYYSLYGYPIKTTPFLDSIHSAIPSQLDFYNGIAAATLTRNAVRLAITFMSPLNTNLFFEEKNIVEMANDVGYETIWVSNQDEIGLYETPVSLIATSASYSYFNDKVDRDDLDLIPIVRAKLKSDKKQFIVMHLLGSHMSYIDRFDQLDIEAIDENGVQGEYDRSIHHTDRLLREVCHMMQEDTSSVLYYFSDHGEKVGVSHGFKNGGVDQFKMPVITINKSTLPLNSIIDKYIDTNTQYLNSQSSVYILSEILGYKVSTENVDVANRNNQYIYQVDNTPQLFSEIEANVKEE